MVSMNALHDCMLNLQANKLCGVYKELSVQWDTSILESTHNDVFD